MAETSCWYFCGESIITEISVYVSFYMSEFIIQSTKNKSIYFNHQKPPDRQAAAERGPLFISYGLIFSKKKAIPNKRDSFTVHPRSLIIFLKINDSLRIRNINAVGIKGVLDLGHGIIEYRQVIGLGDLRIGCNSHRVVAEFLDSDF